MTYDETIHDLEQRYHVKFRSADHNTEFRMKGWSVLKSGWTEIGPFILDVVLANNEKGDQSFFILCGSYGSPFVQLPSVQEITDFIDREIGF